MLTLLSFGEGAFAISQHQYNALYFFPKNYTEIPALDFDNAKIVAIEKKDDKLMYSIGMMYHNGNKGIEVDFVQAREWLTRAAFLKNSNAMLQLARIYTYGKDITGFFRSESLSKKWIQDAIRAKNYEAFFQIGLWYERGDIFRYSREKAYEYYQKAADANYFNAYVKMFIGHLNGYGVEQDTKKAIYYIKLIEKNAPNEFIKKLASQFIAELYFEIAKKINSAKEKFNFYLASYNRGFKTAANAIGDSYLDGVGVEEDARIALLWYHRAINEFESIYAMERVGLIYLNGPGQVDRDYKKAFEYFDRASKLGSVNASYFLGHMYYYGLGVESNYDEARKWFTRSSNLAKISYANAKQGNEINIEKAIQENLEK